MAKRDFRQDFMEFTQRIDGLIGEEKCIKMLETKDLSRLLVVSDYWQILSQFKGL